jgi:hypothetical protein
MMDSEKSPPEIAALLFHSAASLAPVLFLSLPSSFFSTV